MNCPEHYLVSTKWLRVLHWQHADVARRYVTWREVFNPLRYEVGIGRAPGWVWNDDAWMRVWWSNFWFRLRKGCWIKGHDYRTNKFRQAQICDRCFAHKKEGQVDEVE